MELQCYKCTSCKKRLKRSRDNFFAKEFGIGYKLGRRKNLEEACFICCLSKFQIKFKAWHFQSVHAQSVSFLKLDLECFDK